VIHAKLQGAKPLAPYLQSVLVIEPNPMSARLMREVLSTFGARGVCIEATTHGALARIAAEEVMCIFTELTGPELDGFEFMRQLRRSDSPNRQAPVIVCVSAPTARDIFTARDAGAHEFLRKPFSVRDLQRRIEAAAVKPRRWVKASAYIGPDRRRFNSGDYKGTRRRQADTSAPGARVGEAVQSLRFAMGSLENDPQEALRAMQTQAAELVSACKGMGDESLSTNAAGLQRTLETVVAAGTFDGAKLEEACAPFWSYLPKQDAEA